jgi:DNA modification methylase
VNGIEVQCKDAVDLLRSLKPETVQTIIADPPGGLTFPSSWREGGFEPRAFLQASFEALLEGGALYLFTRWESYPMWLGLVPEGLELKNNIVWVTNNWSAGDLAGNFGDQYETILFFTKGRHRRRGRRWSNVWQFPRVLPKKLRVPAEKPVDLVARIIEASAIAGDLVVDPYCGSGTTGEALQRFRGIRGVLGDLDPKMVRMTCERIGISAPHGLPQTSSLLPPCPIHRLVPPDPHLWGIYPDDLARFMRRTEAESSIEEGTWDVLSSIETLERMEDE